MNTTKIITKKKEIINQNIKKIIYYLKKEYEKKPLPLAEQVEKQTKDPYKILISTILSARTKDSLTIKIIPNLPKFFLIFNHYLCVYDDITTTKYKYLYTCSV
jgi:endonuclease III